VYSAVRAATSFIANSGYFSENLLNTFNTIIFSPLRNSFRGLCLATEVQVAHPSSIVRATL
jgi:hypothetical protein